MLYLRTFGGLQIERPGGEPRERSSAQGRLALLAVIAAAGTRGISREGLQAIFWPESDADRARGALKQMLYMLRRETEAPELVLGSTVLRLNDAVVASDVGDFDAACRAAEWERAAALYTGAFLDGVHWNEGTEFERWVERERDQLESRHRAALRRLAMAADERGDTAAAVAWWRALAAADPLSATVCRSVMKALVRAGDRPAALTHAQAFQESLRIELEVAGDPAVEALASEIRAELGGVDPGAGEHDIGTAARNGAPTSGQATAQATNGGAANRGAAEGREQQTAPLLSTPEPESAAATAPAGGHANAAAAPVPTHATQQAPDGSSEPRRSGRLAGWRALGVPMALTLLLAVGIGIGVSIARRQGMSQPMRFALNFDGDLELAAAPGPLAVSPNGRVVAFAAQQWGARARIYVRPVDDMSAREMPGTEDAQQLFFSPDGKWIGYYARGRLMRVPAGGGMPLVIAPLPEMHGASWAADDRIVVSSRGALAEVPASGGPLRPISSPDTAAGEITQRWPLVLGDGRTILYTARGRILEEGRIAVISRDGTRKRIFDLLGTAPRGILDGRLIYASGRNLATDRNALLAVPFDARRFEPTGVSETVVDDIGIDVDGAPAASVSAVGSLVYLHTPPPRRQVLARRVGEASRVLIADTAQYRWPRFSPDAQRVVVESGPEGDNHAYVFDRQRGTMTLLTEGRAGYPEWTPDGRGVFYLRPPGNGGIWWRPVDRSLPETVLLHDDSLDIKEAVISRDGRTTVVRVNDLRTYARSIWYRTGDSAFRPLVRGPWLVVGPQLSPDGRWIAYSSMERGSRQVFVADVRSGARYQVSDDHGWSPMWGDARHVYYVRGRQLIDATVRLEPSFAVIQRTVVMDGGFDPIPAFKAPFDVSDDGRELLYLRRVSPDPRVIFVHDWREELRARETVVIAR